MRLVFGKRNLTYKPIGILAYAINRNETHLFKQAKLPIGNYAILRYSPPDNQVIL